MIEGRENWLWENCQLHSIIFSTFDSSCTQVDIFLQRICSVFWIDSHFPGRHTHHKFLGKECLTQLKEEILEFVEELFGEWGSYIMKCRWPCGRLCLRFARAQDSIKSKRNQDSLNQASIQKLTLTEMFPIEAQCNSSCLILRYFICVYSI